MTETTLPFDSKVILTLNPKKPVTMYSKIVPNSFKATKDVASYALKGQPIKPCKAMRTGVPLGITAHNTNDIPKLSGGYKTPAEQYAAATWNCNMGGAIVQYYVSPGVTWQLLSDIEQGWHSGAGSTYKTGNRGTQISGNLDTISIEIIGSSSEAEETGAILMAFLCKKHKLEPALDIYPHKFWSGKQCPIWILPRWDKFIATVKANISPAANPVSPPVTSKPDRYAVSGLTLIRAKNPQIKYVDGSKLNQPYPNYINAGFWGTFDEGITLPGANLCADIDFTKLHRLQKYYLEKVTKNGKLVFNCMDNFVKQFKGKNVSTLVIPETGKPYIKAFNGFGGAVKYGISGMPVIIGGKDASWTNDVLPQGWDSSPVYATYRNFAGIRDGEVWIIFGASKTANHISTSETFNALKGEGFSDVIALDGGGSFVVKENGKITAATTGDRRINNILTWEV
ncbi:MAG: N-acetylmuramoyl-L-alanine amidase [Oscillospiraceae bacterium]|nr:N-acetylmuramoyl-L-alanine amidase [Oscillospiraceae bacterium]